MATPTWSPVAIGYVSPDIVNAASELARRLKPQRIILFGSHAYGQPHAGSDIDLLVVMEQIPERRTRSQLERDIHAFLPLQLLFIRPDEFEETKDVVGGIAYPAHHWGKVLYAENA